MLTHDQKITALCMMVLFSATATFLPVSMTFGAVESGSSVKKERPTLLKGKEQQEDVKKGTQVSSEKAGTQIKDGSQVSKRSTRKSPALKTKMLRTKQKKSTVAQVQKKSGPAKADTRKPKNIQKQRVPLTLDQAINLALQHNLNLQIQAFGRDSVQTSISQAQAAFHPSLVGSLNVSSDEAGPDSPGENSVTTRDQTASLSLVQPLPTGSGASMSITSSLSRTSPSGGVDAFTGEIGVSIAQPLLRGGRMFVATQQIANAEYGLKIQEARLRQEALQVILLTKQSYYEMLQAEKQIDVTKQSIERSQILKDTSVGLFEGGLTTLRDVYSADIDLSGDRATLAGNQAELEIAQNSLLNVLGIPIPTTEVVLLDKDVSFQPVPLELETWLKIALENRPEIMSIKQQLARQDLEIQSPFFNFDSKHAVFCALTSSGIHGAEDWPCNSMGIYPGQMNCDRRISFCSVVCHKDSVCHCPRGNT